MLPNISLGRLKQHPIASLRTYSQVSKLGQLAETDKTQLVERVENNIQDIDCVDDVLLDLQILKMQQNYDELIYGIFWHVIKQTPQSVVKFILATADPTKLDPRLIEVFRCNYPVWCVYREFYSLIFRSELDISDVIAEEIKYLKDMNIDVQHEVIELFCRFSKVSFGHRCKLHIAIKLGIIHLCNISSLTNLQEKIDIVREKPQFEQVIGDTLTDIYFPVIAAPSFNSDVIIKNLLRQLLSYDAERQKLLLDVAGNYVYETASIEVVDNELVSKHGANFYNKVCPWQIICPLELFDVFDLYPPGAVLQSIFELLLDKDFVVLAVDYQTLLQLVFSRYGYFLNEYAPDDEDWGDIQIENYKKGDSSINKLPKRKVINVPELQEARSVCVKILKNCMIQPAQMESEAVERQEVACTYFLGLSCQLLINRPSFLMFIIQVLLELGEELSDSKSDLQLEDSKYFSVMQHLIEPTVIDAFIKHVSLTIGIKYTGQLEHVISKCNISIFNYLKVLIGSYPQILEKMIEQKTLGRLFRIIKDHDFRPHVIYDELLRQMFGQLLGSPGLFRKLLQNFDVDIIDDLIQILDKIEMKTETVILQQLILNMNIQINERSLEVISKTVVVPPSYINQLLDIYEKTQKISYFMYEQDDTTVIHQPLLFYNVLLHENDKTLISKYVSILNQWQNVLLLDWFPTDFCFKVLSFSQESVLEDGSKNKQLLEIAAFASVFNPTWLEMLLKQFPDSQQMILKSFNWMLGNSKYFSLIDVSRGIISADWLNKDFCFDKEVQIQVKYQINGKPEQHNVFEAKTTTGYKLSVIYDKTGLKIQIGTNTIVCDVFDENIRSHTVILDINSKNKTVQVNEKRYEFKQAISGSLDHLKIGQFSSKIDFFLRQFTIKSGDLLFDLNPVQLRPGSALIEEINVRQVQKFSFLNTFDGIKHLLTTQFQQHPHPIMSILRYWVQLSQPLDVERYILIENGIDMKQNTTSDFNNYLSLSLQEISLLKQYALNLNRYFTSDFNRIEKVFELGLGDRVKQYINCEVKNPDELQIILLLLCVYEIPLPDQSHCDYLAINKFITKILSVWEDSMSKQIKIDLLIQLLSTGATTFQVLAIVNFLLQYSNKIDLNVDITVLGSEGSCLAARNLLQMFYSKETEFDGTLNWILCASLRQKTTESTHTQLIFIALIILYCSDERSLIQQYAVKAFLTHMYEVIAYCQLDFMDYYLISIIAQHKIAHSLIESIERQPTDIGIFALQCFALDVDDEMVMRQLIKTIKERSTNSTPFLCKMLVKLLNKQLSPTCYEIVAAYVADFAELCYQNVHDQFLGYTNLIVQLFKPLNVQIQEIEAKLFGGLEFQSAYSSPILDFVFGGDSKHLTIRANLLERHMNLQFQAAIQHLGMKRTENFIELNDVFGDLQAVNYKTLTDIALRFLEKEVQRIEEVPDIVQKTEQSLRAIIFAEGIQGANLRSNIFLRVKKLFNPVFERILSQMDTRRQEINEKVHELIPFSYLKSNYNEIELFYELSNAFNSVKTRLFLHILLCSKDKEFYDTLLEHMPSKIKLTAKAQQQIAESQDEQFLLKQYDSKKDIKASGDEARYIAILFVYMLLGFNVLKDEKYSLTVAVYIYRFAKSYRKVVSEIATAAKEVPQFIDEINASQTMSELRLVLSNSSVNREILAEIMQIFEGLRWDFRGQLDERVLSLDLQNCLSSVGSMPIRIQNLRTRYQQNLDQRIVRAKVVYNSEQDMQNVMLKYSVTVKQLKETFKANLFIFNEIYVVHDNRVQVIELQMIRTAVAASAKCVKIELSNGLVMLFECQNELTLLNNVLASKLRNQASPQELLQKWSHGGMTTLKLLSSLADAAGMVDAVLPGLFKPGTTVLNLTEVNKLPPLNPVMIPGVAETYGYQPDAAAFQTPEFLRDLRLLSHDCGVEDKIIDFAFKSQSLTAAEAEQAVMYVRFLESKFVKMNLHYWIDLTYGVSSVLNPIKFKEILKDNAPPCTELPPVQSLKILKTNYEEYLLRGQFLLCFQNGWFYYDMIKGSGKPIAIPHNLKAWQLFEFNQQLFYSHISQLNVVSVYDLDGVLQFQFRPFGPKIDKIFFGTHNIYLVSENSIFTYQKNQLFSGRQEALCRLYLNERKVISAEEFEFDKEYLFIQFEGYCEVCYGTQVLYRVDAEMNSEQGMTSKYKQQQLTGKALFDIREGLIKETIEKAKGLQDTWFATGRIWVRGIRLWWYE